MWYVISEAHNYSSCAERREAAFGFNMHLRGNLLTVHCEYIITIPMALLLFSISFMYFSLFLQNKDTYEPFCKVPLVTSSKEEQRLIATSNKVQSFTEMQHSSTE